MAGQSKYIVRHADGEQTETVFKGGKVPTFATWALFTEDNPHWQRGAGWVRIGWTYQADEMTAQKKCLPDFRKYGLTVKVTQVLPASL